MIEEVLQNTDPEGVSFEPPEEIERKFFVGFHTLIIPGDGTYAQK